MNISKALIFCLLTVLSFKVQAMDTPSISGNTFRKAISIAFQDSQAETINIRILDAAGIILSVEDIKVNGRFERVYDLHNLPAGEYLMELDGSIKTLLQPFKISSTAVEVSQDKMMIIYKPLVQVNGNNLDINYLAGGKKVKLELTDNQSQEVFKVVLKPSMSIHKRLDMSRLPAGSYQLKIKKGREVYYHSIQL